MKSNKNWRYDIVARLLHWVIAILLTGLIGVGWYMGSIKGQPNSGWYFNLHKSFGLIAGVLIFFRLFWRFTHKPAPLPSTVPHWQAILSKTIHWLLYLCMLIMPITGFLGASFGKYGVTFFGVKLPAWVNQNHAISKQFFEVHEVVAWVLVGLIVLHILAAIKHLVINKDKVFQRIWFY